MKITRRTARSAVALTALTGLVALAGCSSANSSASSDDSVTIPDEDPTATVKVLSIADLKTDNMQQVVDAFEEAHPNITVEWQTVPFDSLSSTIDSRVSNKGGDPDVYWADQPRIAALASRGMAQDITDTFAEYEDAFDATAWEASSYQDALYGLPIANSTQLLYYNKDLLDAAGVEYPSADPENRSTWEQITEDAAAAVAAGAEYGLTFGQFDRYYQLEALPVSKGGSVGATGDDNLTPDFTSDEWVEAMEWYGSLFESGVSPRGVTPEETDGAFLGGQTAYDVTGPWLLPSLEESEINWGVAAHPTFDGGEPVTATGSWSLAMNPFSKNKEAAAIFMKWMAIDDGSGYIQHRPNPELPANIEGKPGYYEKSIFQSEEGQKAAEIIDYETSNTAVSRVSTIGYIEFETILNQTFADIRNGTDPAEALEAGAEELTAAWAKYQ